MYRKLYVEMEVLEGIDGSIVPQAIIYNGERYLIERIIKHQERHHSKNVKRAGEMFVVQIGHSKRTLYREYLLGTHFRWFIESPEEKATFLD